MSGSTIKTCRAKTGRAVIVEVPAELIGCLHSFPQASAAYFFWSGAGIPRLAARTYNNRFRRIFDAAGLPEAHPHRFRHTFAVSLLLGGATMDQVAVLLGHSTSRTTERHYAAWTPERLELAKEATARAWQAQPVSFADEIGAPATREEELRAN